MGTTNKFLQRNKLKQKIITKTNHLSIEKRKKLKYNIIIYQKYKHRSKYNFLKTETYQIALTPKGEFIELVNWEFFAQVLIDNIKKVDGIDKVTRVYTN